MKSVFLTGASGVGKSTTFRNIVELGFTPSPNHLTRPARVNEIDGFDAHFITIEQFVANMAIKAYLENTMEEAEYGGVYYGSPVTWGLEASKENHPFVAIPSNVVVLRSLLNQLEARRQRDSILWANLHAPLETRHDRVSTYVSDLAQLHHRLHNGVGQGIKPDADINIDTGIFTPSEVLEQVIALAK